jgi:hypothetical protein
VLRRFFQLTAAVAVILPSLVCAQQPAGPATPAGASDVAARVGDRVITIGEVDEAWRAADPGAQAQAANALYEGRRQALERLLADLLIERAAQAKGVPAAQFAKDEIARRMSPVTEADVDAFYQQNVSRMQGKRLDEVRGPIRSFLQQQREAAARSALVSELRASGPPVSVALDPPRVKVDVAASDPSRGAASAAVVLVEYSDYQ